MARTRPWELGDDLWERVQPLLTLRQESRAILHVLRAGLQRNALPRAIGASTTVYDRFRAWECARAFERV